MQMKNDEIMWRCEKHQAAGNHVMGCPKCYKESGIIDPLTLELAIQLLKKPKKSNAEIYQLIATFAGMLEAKTFTNSFIPEDMIVIGIGPKHSDMILSSKSQIK